jgi:ABC-type proline/glycine betaine transport system substrate-binding protein
MKKYLFFMFIVAFSASMSAQTMPSLSDAKDAGMKTVSKSTPDMSSQITEALKKDPGLQKEAVNYLKENPKTAATVASMAAKNGGSTKGLMNSILGDKDLTTAAIEYISSNPELLSKAMKIIGM